MNGQRARIVAQRRQRRKGAGRGRYCPAQKSGNPLVNHQVLVASS
jgi:hypothetical protein